MEGLPPNVRFLSKLRAGTSQACAVLRKKTLLANMERAFDRRHQFPFMHLPLRSPVALAATVLALASSGFAQQNRISKRVDNSHRVALTGQVHPRALAENDRGRVAPDFQLNYVTVTLTGSDAQKADLANLLAEQQEPTSANYHRWLTPAEFADRFGLSASDFNQVRDWLRGQGLAIAAEARGRDWIAVNGTAAQMETAFSTELHYYAVNGVTHFANASNPSVPAALSGVVASIRGLHDFKLKPALVKPKYTSQVSGKHYIGPGDFATIYNVAPAYAAGIDGTGQKIVVAGQTDIDINDMRLFQTFFNMPSNLPTLTLVPNSPDPGTNSGDEGEADLDLEWAGAVARNASIQYVYSNDVMTSVQYAIDNNLAPVISLSYGSCELENYPSDARTFQALAQKGNALGITWVNASGDNGGPDCADAQNPGLSVDMPASIPEVTGIGGTTLAEGSGTFWNSTNDAYGSSALTYIPEVAWNDTIQDGAPSASGGGVSIYYARPSWQTGPGVPNDNGRHVPDISMSSSADHDGYVVYNAGTRYSFGGTSAPTPAFAGVVALMNQYVVSRGIQSNAGLGNVNPKLYALAQQNLSVFHDITSGDNIVGFSVCPSRRTCVNEPAVGYTTGTGYDSVTGLGSIDAWRMMNCWTGSCPAVVTPPTSSVTLLSNLTSVGPSDTTLLTATVSTLSGSNTPVGAVTFTAGSTSLGSATLVGSAGVATATVAVLGSQLPTGTTTVVATYNGNSGSTPVTSSVALNVRTSGTSSNGTPAVTGAAEAASFQTVYSPGMIVTVFGSQLSSSTASAASVPLPVTLSGVSATVNGVTAPLLYVSPSQMNIQVPYETAIGPATLVIDNNGALTMSTFNVQAASPGIFADFTTRALVPSSSASRGSLGTLFLTGMGAVSPAVPDGYAPASSTPVSALPQVQNISVTVAGIAASTTCSTGCFAGIPYGLSGVAQVNFQVPSGAPLGVQPVIVTVNGVSSTPAYLTVTN